MAKKRKVKKSVATAVLLWLGRRMLGRVQKRTLQSVTRKPKATSSALGMRRRSRKQPDAAVTIPTRSPVGRRAGQGIALALLSAAAIAALKVGVEHVIESEREANVVTPDFDVFADDDE